MCIAQRIPRNWTNTNSDQIFRMQIRTGQISSKNKIDHRKIVIFYMRLDGKRYKFEEKRVTEIRRNKQRKK